MNDLRKAAEMALEALDSEPKLLVDWINEIKQAKKELRQALAQPEQEPVGYIDGMHGGYMVFTPLNPSAVYLNGTALYLAPPKREWVGLTDEDLSVCDEDGVLLAKYWEAKLKEKNT